VAAEVGQDNPLGAFGGGHAGETLASREVRVNVADGGS